MKNRTRVLFLATAFVALAVCGGVAFAQPGPTPTPAPSPLSTMTMAVLIINIVVGFIGQGIGQGNILGIVTVPKTYVPYLTVLAAFGTSVGAALGLGQPVLSAILYALLGLATGSALSHHVGTPARTQSMTEGNGGKPPASSSPSSTAAKVTGAAGVLLLILGLAGQTAACNLFGQVAPPAADCGLAIAVDASKGMTIAQIYADVSGRCGQDLSAIVTALLASQDPAVTSSTAFAEAVKLKASVLAAGGAK